MNALLSVDHATVSLKECVLYTTLEPCALFKETLFDTLGRDDRGWSRQIGAASMALLFKSAAALLKVGQPVALDSTF